MFLKIITVVLSSFIVTSLGDNVWNGLTTKWSENISDAFYNLPQTLNTAKSEGWTEIEGVNERDDMKPLSYKNDPRLVLYFSKLTGKVIGHQVGFPASDIDDAGVPIDYTKNIAITEKILNGVKYYTGSAFYYEDEFSNTRRIWIQNQDGIIEIPTDPKVLLSKTSYQLNNCIEWMGIHYYKLNSTTDCGNIYPWLFLQNGKNEIIGIGFQAIGNVTSGPERTWFEDIPSSIAAMTFVDPPECLSEYTASYGVTSLHVWFIKDPILLTCDN